MSLSIYSQDTNSVRIVISEHDTLICGSISKIKDVTKGLLHESELTIENKILNTKIDSLYRAIIVNGEIEDNLKLEIDLCGEEVMLKENQIESLNESIDIFKDKKKRYRWQRVRNTGTGILVGLVVGLIINNGQ